MQLTVFISDDDFQAPSRGQTAAAVCAQCPIAFCSKGTLERHIRKQHPSVNGVGTGAVTDSVSTVGTNRFLCSLCGSSFGSSQGLNLHRRVKHGQSCVNKPAAAVCAQCLTTFSSKGTLERHIRKQHPSVNGVGTGA